MSIEAYNREAWDREVERGNRWTLPVTPEQVARARRGEWSVLLTPTRPVPRDWFGELAGRSLLGLASAGGQQAPLLAAAGAEVTVLDNSPRQLDQDRAVAEREGLTLRLELGVMADLSRFPDASFDLVFHPVSNVFAPSVPAVWREVARVLRPGGLLLAGFTNPMVYLFDWAEQERSGRLKVRYRIPYADEEQLPADELARRRADGEPLEFGHSLEDQIGGQLRAGLRLTHLFEDEDPDNALSAHTPTFVATRACKATLR